VTVPSLTFQGLERASQRKSDFLREEHGREVMDEAARRELAE
jgi:hypothetical protein